MALAKIGSTTSSPPKSGVSKIAWTRLVIVPGMLHKNAVHGLDYIVRAQVAAGYYAKAPLLVAQHGGCIDQDAS
jgi:hypothetical protein